MRGTKVWARLKRFFCRGFVAGGFHLKAGLGQENPDPLENRDVSGDSEERLELMAEPISALQQCCTNNWKLSLFVSVFPFLLGDFSVVFGTQEGLSGRPVHGSWGVLCAGVGGPNIPVIPGFALSSLGFLLRLFFFISPSHVLNPPSFESAS